MKRHHLWCACAYLAGMVFQLGCFFISLKIFSREIAVHAKNAKRKLQRSQNKKIDFFTVDKSETILLQFKWTNKTSYLCFVSLEITVKNAKCRHYLCAFLLYNCSSFNLFRIEIERRVSNLTWISSGNEMQLQFGFLLRFFFLLLHLYVQYIGESCNAISFLLMYMLFSRYLLAVILMLNL